MIFMVFSWFHHENRLVGNFHYYIRNQHVNIRKHGEFDWNRKVHLFKTAPLMGFRHFFLKISFFSKNYSFKAKMYWTSKIDLFIRHNFCEKYFFPRSMFIDIKCKNLLKTFLFSFDLENQICGYFHHHIRNQRLKKVGIVSFKLIGSKTFSEVHSFSS